MMSHQSQDKLKTFGTHVMTFQLLEPPPLFLYSALALSCFQVFASAAPIFLIVPTSFPSSTKMYAFFKYWLSYPFLYVAFSFSSKLVAVFTKLYGYSAKSTSFRRPSKSLVGCGNIFNKFDMI